jgi:heme-degrading monooxygenase HmoA
MRRRTDGDGRHNYVTTAVWESEQAFENAQQAVAAELQKRGYNPQQTAKELKIAMEKATYRRTPY